jgi:hypothetical protein
MTVDRNGNLINNETVNNMAVYVTYPNPEYGYKFEAYPAVFEISDTKETFVLGFHHGEHHNQMTVLGIKKTNLGSGLFVYPVKQQGVKYYNKLLSAKVGKIVEIHSDISSGFWMPMKAVKINHNQLFEILHAADKISEINKTPRGFLI